MKLATIRTSEGATRAVRVDGDTLVDLGAGDLGELLADSAFFDPTLNPPVGAWKPKAGNGGVSTFFPRRLDAGAGGQRGVRCFQELHAAPRQHVGRYLQWRHDRRFYNQSGGFTHGWPVP